MTNFPHWQSAVRPVAALVSERTGLESELAAVSEEIAGITGISGLSLTE
ncbi:Uncharacterised protein [Enterobacter asburiae]|uniref:Uncharacterized protein n=1 Tax=Enterobacter asburiae TaxID=61645 RepID=A0A376F4X9_ENTAS|nr:Uncharacterised protein [Enterobacter asburiae]